MVKKEANMFLSGVNGAVNGVALCFTSSPFPNSSDICAAVQVVRLRLLYGHVRTWNKTRGTKNASIFLRMDAVIFLQVCIMYNLLFPKSKVLNFLTPFILFMSSSRTIFLVLHRPFY